MILIGLSILIFLADFINIYFTNDNNIRFFYNTVGALFEIINFCLLNIFIFRQKFYRHHIISFIIISISLIILFIIYAIGNKFDLHIILYFYLYSLFYSLFFFCGKKYLDTYFQSPYYMLSVIASINTSFLLLYDILAYFINDKYSGIILGFKNNINSFTNFLCFFGEILLLFINNFGIWMTIYYLTPFHFIISEYTAEIIKFYIKVITKSGDNDYYYEIHKIIIFTSVYFINLLCSLIFNEIIILNFCQLGLYTKKFIKEREKIESPLLIGNEREEYSSYYSINI